MSLAWPSLDGAMPAIDLANVADRALSTPSATAMWIGIGLVGLGFLVRVLGEAIKSSTDEGHAPRYLREILVLVGFVAAMASYKPVVLGTVRVVSRLGSEMGSVSTLEETFARRMARFADHIHRQREEKGWAANLGLTVDGVVARVFQLATMFVFVGVQCVMFIIKAVQLFVLAAIITYGPVLIGVSTLGGIFAGLGLAWFWALVEVSAWSFTVDVLLHVFAGFGSSMPEEFSYVQEIIVAVTLMALLVATIPLTGALVRGHGASVLAQSTSYMAARTMGVGATGLRLAGAAAAPAARKAGAAMGPIARRVGPQARAGLGGGLGGQVPPVQPPWMEDKMRSRQGKPDGADSDTAGRPSGP